MLAGILISLLVLTAFLTIPVGLEFTLAWPDDEQNDVVLIWALGLVRTPVVSANSRLASPSASKPRDLKKRGGSKSEKVLKVIHEREFRRRIYRFIRDVWHSIKKNNVRLQARIGLGDPADTGKMWAVFGPLSAIVSGVKDVSVAIAPDFVDEIFEIEGQGKLRLVPLQIIVLAAGLLFSPTVWRGICRMRAS